VIFDIGGEKRIEVKVRDRVAQSPACVTQARAFGEGAERDTRGAYAPRIYSSSFLRF
jgi:hypothetical protein